MNKAGTQINEARSGPVKYWIPGTSREDGTVQ